MKAQSLPFLSALLFNVSKECFSAEDETHHGNHDNFLPEVTVLSNICQERDFHQGGIKVTILAIAMLRKSKRISDRPTEPFDYGKIDLHSSFFLH